MQIKILSRLRKKYAIRALIRETNISVNDLVRPIFVTEFDKKIEINSMPGQYHYPLDYIEATIENSLKLGINSIMLFGIPQFKDKYASDTIKDDGIIQKAVMLIKKTFPEIVIITDACFCQYNDHGHCGILDHNGQINRNKSLKQLQRQAISHAKAGADYIAPSCMIDGMVYSVRQALDKNDYKETGILSYAVKYSSSFYGPFRDAAKSSPKEGNRKTYQIDPANKREAIKEAKADENEGADIIMIKPAMPYLDIISDIKNNVDSPIAAFQVSGEYAMIKSIADQGWIDEMLCIKETLIGIKRSGADIIITYFANQIAEELKKASNETYKF